MNRFQEAFFVHCDHILDRNGSGSTGKVPILTKVSRSTLKGTSSRAPLMLILRPAYDFAFIYCYVELSIVQQSIINIMGLSTFTAVCKRVTTKPKFWVMGRLQCLQSFALSEAC